MNAVTYDWFEDTSAVSICPALAMGPYQAVSGSNGDCMALGMYRTMDSLYRA